MEHPLLGGLDLHRDPDGRLLGLGDLARCSYTDGWLTGHERDGATTRLTRDEQGRVVAADTDGRTRIFGYDAAGQLIIAGDRGYTYDAGGRLVGETGPDGERTRRYDAAGQLTSSTGPDGRRQYHHDAAGRRIAEDGVRDRRTYRWDPLGRPTGVDTVTDGVTRSTPLHVDALGELVRAGDVALDWDTADPLAPLVGLGGRAVVGHPWAALLDDDGQHDVGADPWGRDAAGPGVGLGYRGELVVDGLVWLRARAYDPATRAFLSPDPLPAVPGTAYAANPYHYAGNDPVNNVDPRGLRPVTDAELAGEHDKGGGLLSSIGHGILDVAGLVPGVGEVADLANAAWYAAEGDYTMAALSAAAAIPFAGWAATGAKGAIKGARVLDTATDAGRLIDAASAAQRGADDVLFGQRRIGEAFGTNGRPPHLAGRPVGDVVGDLQAGRLSSDDVPLEVFRDPNSGALVSANTRSLAALSEAGMRPTNITNIEPTSNLLNRLREPPIIPGATLPSRSVPVTPSQSDPTILRIISIPD